MSFASLEFVALLAVVLALRWTIGRESRARSYLALLLAASIVFYGWHVPAYLGLLAASTITDFYLARRIARSPRAGVRRALLVVSVALNLGLLGAFKYADFFLDLVDGLGALGAWGGVDARLGWVLPIGISFYTFQSLSYTIDVYRGEIDASEHLGEFCLFVSFFPQLVAGPIVRARDFLPQLHRRRRPHLVTFNRGVYLIIRGFFLKMVCADGVAPLVERAWEAGASGTAAASLSLVGALLFAAQIFYDFAGYTCIACGVAVLLGFRLPDNFDNPYLATSFKSFWERWHISLSRWLRDYLYRSLGGNRISARRTYINLMLVMVLGGLWHGAGLTFVAWGALHGIALAVERALGLHREDRGPAGRVLWWLVVQAGVLIAWVLFRSPDLATGAHIIQTLVDPDAWARSRAGDARALVWALPLVLFHARGLLVERGVLRRPGPREDALWAAVMLVAIMTLHAPPTAFIYFQF